MNDSEVAQIRALLPKFVEAWKGYEGVLQEVVPALREVRRRRMKPVRCLWARVDDVLWRGEKIPLNGLDFTPLICVSASGGAGFIEGRAEEVVVGGIRFPRRNGFEYMQGGGDDEESWSFGMKAEEFWRFREEILGGGTEGIEKRVREVVMSRSGVGKETGVGVRVWKSGVWIGGVEKGVVANAAVEFGRVIVLGVEKPKGIGETEEEWKRKVMWVPLKGKNGKVEHKWAFGRALGPVLREMKKTIVREGKILYLCCAGTNGEWAAGAVIGWLAWHCEMIEEGGDGEGMQYCVGGERKVEGGNVGKGRVLQCMLHFSGTFPQFQISRNTLKQLNRFFTSPMPSSSVNDVDGGSAVR